MSKKPVSILIFAALIFVMLGHHDAIACHEVEPASHAPCHESDSQSSSEDQHSGDHCSLCCPIHSVILSAPLPLQIGMIPILTVDDTDALLIPQANSSIYRPPRIS